MRAWLARTASGFAALAAIGASGSAQTRFTQIAEFEVPEARQGVAVDAHHFYAVDDRALARYTKDGRRGARWEGSSGGPILHLNSAALFGGRVYCAHSNYPSFPMTSSIEVFDAETLEHVDRHDLGTRLGSLTWLDRHDGQFWGVFAGYDRTGRAPGGGESERPYGGTRNTTLVRFGEGWQVVESWGFPAALLERFGEMSNSGGSWGPDGQLYLTGHDRGELYRVRLPREGPVLELEEIIPLGIRGQGIAWDRSEPGVLYGVARASAAEAAAGAAHRVVVFRVREPPGGEAPGWLEKLRGRR
jgi:hypothetical protein